MRCVFRELFGTSEDDVELDHTEDQENGTNISCGSRYILALTEDWNSGGNCPLESRSTRIEGNTGYYGNERIRKKSI